MDIAVVGGGIGGLSTAIALQQRGLSVQVFEAAPAIGAVGKGIWLPTNAMLVLERLGLADAVATKGLALQRIELRDKDAGLLQAIDLKGVKKRLGQTTVSIVRADLQAALVGALEPGSLTLGKRSVEVEHGKAGATVRFEDGTRITAPVVVGADGLRSRVRKAVAGEVALRYAGQTCYLGVADYALSEAGTVRELWGGSARFGYSAVSKEKVYWFAPQTAQAGGAMPREVVQVLLASYRNFPPPVLPILEATPPAEIIKLDLHDFVPLRSWYKGRVVLVGDAAHAMTPNLGQGGAQAIEDAYVLAQTLAENLSAPEAAFQQYERRRQAKAKRVARTAWWLGRMAHVEAPWLRSVRNRTFKLVPERMNQAQAEALYTIN